MLLGTDALWPAVQAFSNTSPNSTALLQNVKVITGYQALLARISAPGGNFTTFQVRVYAKIMTTQAGVRR